MSNTLWAITSYYNPLHYQRRLQNYGEFRRRLAAPLVTVELSLDGRFELTPGDADVLIQLPGRDVMWHKERLLNIALGAVPGDCDKIAWLDCDLIFQRHDWAEHTGDLLDRFPLVEPFTDAYRLRRDSPPDKVGTDHSERHQRSLAFGLASGAVGVDILDQNLHMKGWTSGLAWAARRELFTDRGFYDACIMGSGCRAMACAALGQFDYAVRYLRMNESWADHYRAWAQPHFEAVRGNIGFLEGAVFHLWHGESSARQYLERHQNFARFGYSPSADLATDEHGCWRWNSDKPDMHRAVHDYFISRKEDG